MGIASSARYGRVAEDSRSGCQDRRRAEAPGTPLMFIEPEWSAPMRVRAVMTTRQGGVSVAPWNSLNLGVHVGDNTTAVLENRRRVRKEGGLPSEPVWLEQVHGTAVVVLE